MKFKIQVHPVDPSRVENKKTMTITWIRDFVDDYHRALPNATPDDFDILLPLAAREETSLPKQIGCT